MSRNPTSALCESATPAATRRFVADWRAWSLCLPRTLRAYSAGRNGTEDYHGLEVGHSKVPGKRSTFPNCCIKEFGWIRRTAHRTLQP